MSIPIAARAVEIGRRVDKRGTWFWRDEGEEEARTERNWRRTRSWIRIASQRGPIEALLTGGKRGVRVEN